MQSCMVRSGRLIPAWRRQVASIHRLNKPAGRSSVDWRAALNRSQEDGPAATVHADFGRRQMAIWEVALGRLTAAMFERYLPSFRRGLPPASQAGLRVPHNSYFQLWLCCQVSRAFRSVR